MGAHFIGKATMSPHNSLFGIGTEGARHILERKIRVRL
jgi:hypothetical protein